MSQSSNVAKKNRSIDIIIKLKPREGGTKDYRGQVDNRIFSGENKVHAKMNPQNCLWHLEYEQGLVPMPFRQQYTGLNRLLTDVKNYFDRRNIDIEEIID